MRSRRRLLLPGWVACAVLAVRLTQWSAALRQTSLGSSLHEVHLSPAKSPSSASPPPLKRFRRRAAAARAAAAAAALFAAAPFASTDAGVGPAFASAAKMPAPPKAPTVSFSHVHLYCDSLKELEEYKRLEQKLNAFSSKVGHGPDLDAGRAAWLALGASHGHPVTGEKDPKQWDSTGQDVVEQMLVGLGWRITGACDHGDTRSFVITSKDSNGVQVVMTAHKSSTMQQLADSAGRPPTSKRLRAGDTDDAAAPQHFDASHLERFSTHRAGREGVAVLGFSAGEGGVERLHAKYAELHPKLLLPGTPREYPGAKVLEVYAYYKGEKRTTDADTGTLLRFIETSPSESSGFSVLPGLKPVAAEFDATSLPAYCDHWVSNVVSREGFLDTLEDTLGFTPKVDFNAGVVAAGEAQIESTVTGNDPGTLIPDTDLALKDQSQVYLPINNALSEVGHVHLYLKEIGQGVQHIASRVSDLPALVQRANDFRKMTGAGLSFLSIPRSYYGSLSAKWLSSSAGIDLATAERCVAAVTKAGLADRTGAVDLDASRERVLAALPGDLGDSELRVKIADLVLRARYGNMYALLRDQVGEETYMKIVRNNILVDVQGEDLLMQIFTSTVLQRKPGEEAPFFEFIQRVCSERLDPATGKPKPMKPGCGGFGIRNFLTLFLSIEVSKATKAKVDAEAAGKPALAAYYDRMVDAFTAQLEESNPVLTAISDAMTGEGEALERGDRAEAQRQSGEKSRGQQNLMRVSQKYRDIMADLRAKAPKDA